VPHVILKLTISTPHVCVTDEYITGNESPWLCKSLSLALLHVAAFREGRGDRLGKAFAGGRLAGRRRGCGKTLAQMN
jgi:hypothetical protein